MKLAISHIAWPIEENAAYLRLIRELGCSGVEVAPSRLWAEPVRATVEERRQFRRGVQEFGLEITALQALLYNRPELGLFRGREIEAETIAYLKGLCRLAADLKARVLVFGSPGNRKRGDLPLGEAFEKAAGFFAQVAPTAANLGVCLCIEPLRPQETDFITTAKEGLRLVEMVNSPGFGLHLDAKAVHAEGGNPGEIIGQVFHRLQYFHINDPNLVEVNSTGEVDHGALAGALHGSGYQGYVSIEMRYLPHYPEAVRRSLIFAKSAYLDFLPSRH
jgi:D-psicose/D-tagatose/L-ribulose 3-epimerase